MERKVGKGYKKPEIKVEQENEHVQNFYEDIDQKKIANKTVSYESESVPISVDGAALVEGENRKITNWISKSLLF